MARTGFPAGLAVALLLSFARSVFADSASISDDGINSAGLLLANGLPMNGDGVAIGQVELTRLGKRVADGGLRIGENACRPLAGCSKLVTPPCWNRGPF
jgi:hypothetical protein